MKLSRRILGATIALALCVAPAKHAGAEDIDLFVSSTGTAQNPNILVILDNSANWSSAAQHWPGGVKQGQSELKALRTVINELRPTDAEVAAAAALGKIASKVNLGLMMFTGGQGSDLDGGYLRFHIRPMTQANVDAFSQLIGDPAAATCSGNNTLTGSPNCIYHNFNSPFEKTATADTDYSAALFEAFKYFGGFTDPAKAQLDVAGVPPAGAVAPHTFGVTRRAGTIPADQTGNEYKKFDSAAYTSATKSTYGSSVISATNSCAKNYIILIGNGFPVAEPNAFDTELLFNVNASNCTNSSTCSQLSMPQFTTTSSTATSIIGTACGTGINAGQRVTDCLANSAALQAANPADSYTCINPRLNNVAPCNGNNNFLHDVQSANTVLTVTPTGTFAAPASSKVRHGDEWAKFLYTTDVSSVAAQQNAATYTIDVFKDAQDGDQTALLSSMAKYGGGRYFSATSESAIISALRQILIEIQSVNTVFASASLPINATNRSQNENQVFIGMFRPGVGGAPRWYGNLKRYQIALFSGEAKLADATCDATQAIPDPACVEAVSASTGFVQPCARSFWTTDSGSYWQFSPVSAGQCTTSGLSLFSDRPDGAQVEKGAAAEVMRKGNNPPATDTTPTDAVNRTFYTCSNDGTTVTCKCNAANAGCDPSIFGAMHTFNTTNVSQTAVTALDATEHTRIVDFTLGKDIGGPIPDDDQDLLTTDTRPSLHGDVAHSRPLPVNYGGTTGVVLYYGANDGTFRALQGSDGKELWAFVGPEHHKKLKRLRDNDPLIFYPGSTIVGATAKDYFFDGSAGLYQNSDNSKIWIFPSQRRGGRMLYGFDVTTVTTPPAPRMKWRIGCPNLANDTGCSSGFGNIGQTWSIPSVTLIKGFSFDANPDRLLAQPVIITGGGYDSCEDTDDEATTCTTAAKGRNVFVINADTGALMKTFGTGGTGTIDRSVPSDITLLDRDFDGYADHAYFADAGGNLYRIDFVNPPTHPTSPNAVLVPANWTITKIARTTGAFRKFLFAPSILGTSGKVFIAIGSGDRERPLITNYPFTTPVQNRFYMFMDLFPTPVPPATSVPPVDLDGATMENRTSVSVASCGATVAAGKDGWFIDLTAGTGEQVVTSSTIFGGLVFFSTNRPLAGALGSCSNNLGEARGYAVNLLNAGGAVGTEALCGGTRSAVFVGGGLPPSPVTGSVPVGGKQVTVMIGGVQRSGGASSPIGSQKVKPVITQTRSRLYWYRKGDQ